MSNLLQEIKRLDKALERMTQIKEAYRYYIDAHDNELIEAGITREDALRHARELDIMAHTEQSYTADEANLFEKRAWNAAITRCRQVVNQEADDYQMLGADVLSRRIRALSLLLEGERKELDV